MDITWQSLLPFILIFSFNSLMVNILSFFQIPQNRTSVNCNAFVTLNIDWKLSDFAPQYLCHVGSKCPVREITNCTMYCSIFWPNWSTRNCAPTDLGICHSTQSYDVNYLRSYFKIQGMANIAGLSGHPHTYRVGYAKLRQSYVWETEEKRSKVVLQLY